MTETGQLLPAVSRDRPGGGYGITDALPVRWWRQATVANQPYLAPDPSVRPRTPGDWEHVRRDDLLDDVEAVTALVAAKGMELLVLDQTRPDVGLPVVKVIVPGLRHFWARYAPGRLFDVPVALGRLSAPTPTRTSIRSRCSCDARGARRPVRPGRAGRRRGRRASRAAGRRGPAGRRRGDMSGPEDHHRAFSQPA
ncbi:YcaO-like family protein [Streptomyces diastatochromogenes]|nr:YcaO-like family protein [Streptomyces diastatochromogenes]